ncbi:MAG: M48 family metallopeptidase [Marinilabiliales bacterium]
MAEIIFYIILAILAVGFVLDRVLEYLNHKNKTDKLPPEIVDVYSPDKYKKHLAYKNSYYLYDWIYNSFSFIISFLIIYFYGFKYLDNVVRAWIDHPLWTPLIFFLVLFIIFQIVSLPFSIYSTFVIEEKFGFNKTTIKTFILDIIKSFILTIVIGGGIMALIVWIYNKFPDYFFIIAWGIVVVFMIILNMFYSNLIVPLFNKQKPLEEGELRNKIEEFSKKAGFKLDNIYVIDGSKRSTKANAYFTGLGPKKRITLYDTLINDLTIEEVVAVLAHEIGHYKKRHTTISLLFSILQTGITFYILSFFINNDVFAQALGVEKASFHIGIVAFALLYSPISTLLGIGFNIVSRKNEYAADKYAASFGLGQYLISGLKKLTSKNLGNLTPHPLYVFFNYSHPPLIERIRNINKNS